ncbi:MAG: LysE family translocator [Saprospiraceae bacterium]|nr:LysE family translocator [Saprospiraceae bacterium]MCF8250714.1 LysE family translocator [Saprospiraceae bacterium]MCF8279770.1 LysE family translocator [Bacteroidales bacterium]MCF8310524.1 LysE family translocator [Saprospiraceae bacterium]MCF8440844.1 LysE family translocator [Saprospiraceae bacterium]
MTFLVHFLIAFGLSFVGSLPFGMINMTVAHAAIRKGMQAAVFTALGAALVELIQVFVALKFTWLFAENPGVERIFQVVATVVFFAGGVYFFFFAKSKPDISENDVKPSKRGDFFRGMFISSLNLMVIPYWIFYATLLTTNGWMVNDNQHVVVFSFGTMCGTFALLVLYGYLGARILSKSEQITRWVNKFIGLLLIGFGLFQIVKLLNC